VKAADGFHLWSQTYDRSLDDIFAVQDNIARSVARELQLTLLRAGEDAHGPHAEVYDLLLQARHALGDSKPESLRRGRAFVERALVLDPDYAPVWDVKGLLHLRERDAATTDEERRQANERTRQATAKALELDSDLATAHARMAGVDHFAWEFDDAQRSIEKALAAGPGDTAVLQAAAYLFKRWGRIDEAIALEEETVERDPLDLIAPGNLANSYLLSGRYDEAEGVLRKLVALKPDHPPARGLLGDLYLMQGEVPEARAAYKRSAELQGQANERSRLFYDALLEHAAGNEAVSAAAAAEFETKFGAESPVPCAGLRAWRGEADLAFAWLDRAFAVRSPTLSNIKSNALLRGLHADARWRALLGRIGLPAG
jgi:tetratricopeptide (TPR) repeat protein